MLVLKRKQNESILIGDDIEVKVVEISNGFIKLSINAPKNIKIVRKELMEEIQELNKQSVNSIDMFIKKKGV